MPQSPDGFAPDLEEVDLAEARNPPQCNREREGICGQLNIDRQNAQGTHEIDQPLPGHGGSGNDDLVEFVELAVGDQVANGALAVTLVIVLMTNTNSQKD